MRLERLLRNLRVAMTHPHFYSERELKYMREQLTFLEQKYFGSEDGSEEKGFTDDR